MNVVESGVRAVSSSTAMKASKSDAWSYEPSPPRRRATAANGQPSGASSSDGLLAIEARAEQLARMSQLMRVLSDGGA